MLGGTSIEENHWKELLKQVDKNGDGMISLDEFIDMFLKKVEKELDKIK